SMSSSSSFYSTTHSNSPDGRFGFSPKSPSGGVGGIRSPEPPVTPKSPGIERGLPQCSNRVLIPPATPDHHRRHNHHHHHQQSSTRKLDHEIGLTKSSGEPLDQIIDASHDDDDYPVQVVSVSYESSTSHGTTATTST